MIRVSDYIIERLFDQGIKDIFIVTGRGALFLTDAVAKLKDLNYVCMHHEQSAAYAAVGHSQVTNQISACLVSTGCAATNTISGVLSAWQDAIPVIFISGQNVLNETSRHTGIQLRTFGQQEADIVAIVKPITKYAVMIDDPKKIKLELDKALYLAQNGKKGPVWIDIPLDIQSMRINPDELDQYIPLPPIKDTLLQESIDFILSELKQCKRPAVLIGSGIRSSNSIEDLYEFIKKYSIPLTYTASSPDVYPIENKLSIGSVGVMGCSRAGNFTVQNCDLLLIFGSRLSTLVTGVDFDKFARDAKKIVIDFDLIEHSKKSVAIDRLINSDLKKILSALNNIKKINIPDFQPWIEKCLHWKEVFKPYNACVVNTNGIDLYNLSNALSYNLHDNSILVTDSGCIEIILPTNINFGFGRRSIHPVSQGAMGYALPAAIGAYFASKLPVITVIGDGSIMMNLQELQTIQSLKIPIKVLVISNNAYGIIRKRQKDLFRTRTIGTDSSNGISCPNFSKIAMGFDIPYFKIESNDTLNQTLEQILVISGPVICEIIGLDDQSYVEVAHSKTKDNRYVRRPLEDQAPFLDRNLFLAEMIIDPIDQ